MHTLLLAWNHTSIFIHHVFVSIYHTFILLNHNSIHHPSSSTSIMIFTWYEKILGKSRFAMKPSINVLSINVCYRSFCSFFDPSIVMDPWISFLFWDVWRVHFIPLHGAIVPQHANITKGYYCMMPPWLLNPMGTHEGMVSPLH